MFKQICIYGAGAIGGWLGAGLAAAGHPVNVVARGATLAALRDPGLCLRDGAGADERERAFAVVGDVVRPALAQHVHGGDQVQALVELAAAAGVDGAQ